jgi:hypothetical protein
MSVDLMLIVLGVIGGLIIGYLIAKIGFMGSIKSNRKAAVSQSRAVVLGHVHEKIAPLLPNFPYQYKDLMFLGK